MAYLVANHFELGLDLRKSAVTAPASSFRDLRNVVVNSGGEIQKAKAFVKAHTITEPFVLGIAGDDDKFFYFTKTGASSTPVVVEDPIYKLGIDAAATITRTDSYQPWANGYVISGDTGDETVRRMYYNGVEVTDAASQSWGARVYQGKVYGVAGQILNFSALNDPGNWDSTITPANGAGFINIAGADQFRGDIVALDRFYTQMAVFGVNDVQVWNIDPDPKLNALAQTVANTGLVAPRAHAQYSSGDVLYATRAGIRSLKARDASNYAVTADVGSPVDEVVKDYLLANPSGFRFKMKAVVEPETGSFWLAMGNQILVFSFFPTSKISAWSILEVPFIIDDIAANREQVALLTGNDVYLYGGTTLDQYDATPARVLTPFLDAQKPGSWKQFNGLDIGCAGQWDVAFNVNTNNAGALVHTSSVNNSTFSLDNIPMTCQGTHLQLEFTSSFAGKAVLSSYAVHFEEMAQ